MTLAQNIIAQNDILNQNNSEAHITEKFTLPKQIVIFSELTTKILLKPIVIFSQN